MDSKKSMKLFSRFMTLSVAFLILFYGKTYGQIANPQPIQVMGFWDRQLETPIKLSDYFSGSCSAAITYQVVTTGVLPDGLSLNQATGTIIGQPTNGTYGRITSTIKATCSSPSSTVDIPLTFIINPAPTKTMVINAAKDSVLVGNYYFYPKYYTRCLPENTTFSTTTTALPPGLKLSQDGKAIVGSPKTQVSGTAIIQAECGGVIDLITVEYQIGPSARISIPKPGGGTIYSCSPGYGLTAIGTECTQCPAGSYSDDGFSCKGCQGQQYSDNGAAACQSCDLIGARGGSSVCPQYPDPCSDVKDFDVIYDPATGTCNVSVCGQAHYSNTGFGNQVVRTDSSGKVLTLVQFVKSPYPECTLCSKGYYSPARGIQACLECAAPTVTWNQLDQTGCVPCGTGQIYQNGVCSSSSCQAGQYKNNGTCTNCLAGQFSAGGTATTCSTCPAGTYSGPGVASCSNCPAGYYSPAGSIDCAECSVDTYATNPGTATCTACPTGTTTQGKTGATSAAQCVAIATPAPVTQVNITGTVGIVLPSPVNMSASFTDKCTPAGGTVSYAMSTATPLPADLKLDPVTGSITGTPSVSLSPLSGNFTVLVTCTINGSASKPVSLPGAYTFSPASTVTDCAAGSFINPYTNTCDKCPAGTFSAAVNTKPACRPCANGTFSLVLGATACENCPTGSYAGNAGSLLCNTCLGSSNTTTFCQNPTPLIQLKSLALGMGFISGTVGSLITPINVTNYYTSTATGTPSFTVPLNTLPAGLSLDPTTGIISGTPTVSVIGSTSVTVTIGGNSAVIPVHYNIAPAALSSTTAGTTSGTTSGTTLGTTAGTTAGTTGGVCGDLNVDAGEECDLGINGNGPNFGCDSCKIIPGGKWKCSSATGSNTYSFLITDTSNQDSLVSLYKQLKNPNPASLGDLRISTQDASKNCGSVGRAGWSAACKQYIKDVRRFKELNVNNSIQTAFGGQPVDPACSGTVYDLSVTPPVDLTINCIPGPNVN